MPPVLLSFSQCNPDAVPRLFADFGPDGFGHPENVFRRFHAYEAAVVGLAVKCCMNLDTALTEFLPDIIGKVNVCPIHVRHFLQDGIKRIILGFISAPSLPVFCLQ